MANLKMKPKTLKEALKVAKTGDDEIDYLAPEPGTPAPLKNVTKGAVQTLTAMLEQRSEVLDEESKLKSRLAEIERDKKALEKALREMAPSMEGLENDDDEVEFTLGGMFVKLGKKGTSRELTSEGKKKLLDLLTPDDLFALANFKLGDLDNYLTAKQREAVLKTSRTDRSLKLEPTAKA